MNSKKKYSQGDWFLLSRLAGSESQEVMPELPGAQEVEIEVERMRGVEKDIGDLAAQVVELEAQGACLVLHVHVGHGQGTEREDKDHEDEGGSEEHQHDLSLRRHVVAARPPGQRRRVHVPQRVPQPERLPYDPHDEHVEERHADEGYECGEGEV